jgi:DNA-binding NtrC family response regulator
LIHAASSDPESLVQIDCAALDETSIATELADRLNEARAVLAYRVREPSCIGSSPGELQAHTSMRPGGTLFLNHLSELSPAAQLSALDVLGPTCATHQGPAASTGTIRYLATSTRPLAELVESGLFLRSLSDLFDVTLTIPPLRQRRVDIAMLARHYLRRANPALSMSPAALKALAEYPFPGNVRELLNLVTRLAIVPLNAGALTITRKDIVDHLAIARPLEFGSVRSL